MPPASRMYWMDALRGLAVLLVILQHSTSYPMQRGTDLGLAFVDVSADILAPYRMPLLLLLSGMLLGPSVRKPLKGYYEGKLRKVLWPLLVWGVIVALAQDRVDEMFTIAFWASGPLHMWFLHVIFACYLIGPITRRIPAWVIVIVFFLVLTFVSPFIDIYFRRILYYGIFFFLGSAMMSHLGLILERRVWFPIIMGLAGAAVSLGSLVGRIAVNPYWPIWSLIAPAAGLAAIIWVGPHLPRMRWLEWAGRRSIVLYCAHFPIMVVVTHYMPHLADYSVLHFYFFQMALGLGIPLLLALLYPYVKILFEFPSPRRRPPNEFRPDGPPSETPSARRVIDGLRPRGIR